MNSYQKKVSATEKVPPHDLGMERSILGAVMIDQKVMDWVLVEKKQFISKNLVNEKTL